MLRRLNITTLIKKNESNLMMLDTEVVSIDLVKWSGHGRREENN